jgi:Calcineurin-like phosphoesterase
MMRQSETMRAALRLSLSHPIVCLLAALAAAVVLGVLGPINVVRAADVTVQGESFDRPASGTNIITGTGYSSGAALKFTDNVAASHTVNCSAPCDVVLMASGGQSGGQATFSVNGSLPQALTSTTTTAYTFHLPAGATTISVKAGGTGTGHNAILDVATFSASDGGTDTTAPETTLSPPSVIGTTASFTFSSNEPSSFQCKLVGWDPMRINDCTSPRMYTNLTVGTQYTFKVWAKDAAGNIDPTPATFTFTPSDGTAPAACADGRDNDGDGKIDLADPGCSSPADTDEFDAPTGTTARLVGAGDIATGGSMDTATGDLIDARPDARVFTAGDNAYPDGTASDYTTKYEPAWGGLLKNRTSPSPGNHEYYSGASGYKSYFGSVAGLRSVNPTYYAYTLGAWRVYALDSNISMAIGSAQYNFVQNDLTTNGALCELAYWHHPIASSGQHGNNAVARPIFALFDAQGGDLVLNGHDHNYERFPKINSSGQVSASGVREIIVGTGGANLRGLGFVQPGSEVRNTTTHGIVDINLSSTGYSGKFVPVPGKTFTDTFSGTCGN